MVTGATMRRPGGVAVRFASGAGERRGGSCARCSQVVVVLLSESEASSLGLGCESRGGGDRDRANEARAGGGERRVGCERNSTEAVVVGKGKGYYKGGNRVEMTRREGGNAGRTGGRRV